MIRITNSRAHVVRANSEAASSPIFTLRQAFFRGHRRAVRRSPQLADCLLLIARPVLKSHQSRLRLRFASSPPHSSAFASLYVFLSAPLPRLTSFTFCRIVRSASLPFHRLLRLPSGRLLCSQGFPPLFRGSPAPSETSSAFRQLPLSPAPSPHGLLLSWCFFVV